MPIGVPGASDYDAYQAKNFAIEIGGIQLASFQEVDGLKSEVDVVELLENGMDGRTRLVLTPAAGSKRAEITLKRGKNASLDLWEWHDLVLKGKIADARKEGSVVIQDFENQEVARWNFYNAWPSKISTSALKAGGNEIVMEELTIVAERIERVS